MTPEEFAKLTDYTGLVFPIDHEKLIQGTREHTSYQGNGCGYADYNYHGCGRAWAALNDKVEIVALVYMEAGRCSEEQFSEYRREAIEQLSQFGTVLSGFCSCWEFICYTKLG